MAIKDELKNIKKIKSQIDYLEAELLVIDMKKERLKSIASKEFFSASKSAKKLKTEINKRLYSYYRLYNALINLIEQLNFNEKTVIRLRYLEAKKYDEIAEKMAYSEPQVYRFHKKALINLEELDKQERLRVEKTQK